MRLRYEQAASVADRYADAGFAAVLQDIVLGKDLDLVVRRVRTRPLCVAVQAPEVAAVQEPDAERQRSRGKVGYRPDDQGIAELDRVLREETPRLGYWLDTSHLTIAETGNDIRAHLTTDARIPT